MDFRLTEEQALLRRSVREFAETEIRPHVMEWDQTQHFPSERRPITLNRDVDIVFERERDHVLHRQVQVPSPDQRFQPRRIRQIGRRKYAPFQMEGLQERPHVGHRLGHRNRHLGRLSKCSQT